MKKKFKALYLIIILAVLWIGAGVAAYQLLIKPQTEKTNKAAQDWKASSDAMKTSMTTAQQKQSTYPVNAAKLIDGYRVFHAIQSTMPNIYDMKEAYAGKDREGLRQLYLAMGTGRLTGELKRWTSRYHLSNAPKYIFTGILGYEDTLTEVKMVQVPFDKQTFVAYGYADLIHKIQGRYGYAHFPLIIAGLQDAGAAGGAGAPGAAAPGAAPAGGPGMPPPAPAAPAPPPAAPQQMQAVPTGGSAGMAAPVPADPSMGGAPGGAPGAAPTDGAAAASAGTFTITVDRKNRHHTSAKPALVMNYTAKGAFLTRGWDPNGATVANDLASAKLWINNPPKVPVETPAVNFPLIFGFIGTRPDVQ
ncbi:MAG TPA: hypothetical protein VHV83_20660 [Armatimonadota bacterium]|nr:hypothetical protein [Armatimonadota bacterium]